jgi:acetyl esterase/lipase
VCDPGPVMASTGSPRRAQIEAFFTCQHPEQFRIDWRGFYQRAETRTDEVRSRWEHELDISYGPSERHRLDLYLPIARNGAPATPSAPWPILLFLHGGGFREGDPALYGYLAEPFLARAIAFASVGYRLTPESYLPGTFADVETALTWCVAHLPGRGVDVGHLALAGHSAGAILTAHLAVRDNWLAQRSVPNDLLNAAIPISGNYDFTDPAQHRDFFTTDSDRAASSPLLRLAATPPPMLVAYGSDENQPTFARDSKRLVDDVRARGGRAELLELEGMTHADTADALGDPSSPLFRSVIALFGSAGAALPNEVAARP